MGDLCRSRTDQSTVKMTSLLRLVGVSLFFWFFCSIGVAQSPSLDEEAIKLDLLTALTLEGHPCGAVISFEIKTETDNVTNCENGRRFRLYVSEEGTLKIVALMSSPLKMIKPVLSRFFLIKKSVLGLLNFSGKACDSVLGVQGDGQKGQIISCNGGLFYHIVVTPSGRVEVVASGDQSSPESKND